MPYNLDILVPKSSTYGVLEHFSGKICEAMKRLGGHKCRLIYGLEGLNKALQDDVPDFTFSFNAPPKDHGLFWCDIQQIPHVSILVDTPFHFPGINNSQYIIPTYDDEYLTKTFPNKRFHQKFFVPLGVERELDSDPSLPKIYDVTLLASFNDWEERQKLWEETYPKDIYDAMLKAIDLTLNEEDMSFIKAFEIAYNEILKENRDVRVLAINVVEILIELESYLKGYERICQVQSIHDAEVHIFGASNDIESWQRYFDNQSNVIIHDPVSFDNAILIM